MTHNATTYLRLMSSKDPRSVYRIALSVIDWNRPDWIGKVRSDSDQPAESSFWLYKTRDCMYWLEDILAQMVTQKKQRLNGESPAGWIKKLSAHAGELTRGAWSAECYIACTQLPDITDITMGVMHRMLNELERLRKGRKSGELKDIELEACLKQVAIGLLGHYDNLFAQIPIEHRPTWRKLLPNTKR